MLKDKNHLRNQINFSKVIDLIKLFGELKTIYVIKLKSNFCKVFAKFLSTSKVIARFTKFNRSLGSIKEKPISEFCLFSLIKFNHFCFKKNFFFLEMEHYMYCSNCGKKDKFHDSQFCDECYSAELEIRKNAKPLDPGAWEKAVQAGKGSGFVSWKSGGDGEGGGFGGGGSGSGGAESGGGGSGGAERGGSGGGGGSGGPSSGQRGGYGGGPSGSAIGGYKGSGWLSTGK